MSNAFVSFSFEDLDTVRSIVRELQEKYGISCWFCEMEVPYGEDYKDRIVMAIQDAQTVVLLHSKHAALSENVKNEIGVAKKEHRYVIPCKLDHTDYQGGLFYDLVNDNFLEATGISPEDFVRKLAVEINRVIIGQIAPERNTYKLSSYRTTRNEVFLGRESMLSDIHAAYSERNIVFLHGMGGIGKTEIAQNYAKTYENDYKTIVFARYESSLAALLANDTVFEVKGLQRKTKADNTLQTDEEYARDKMAILKKICDTDTLVIIDNFDVHHDQEPLFHELVYDVPFRVLFTTRNRPSTDYFTVPVTHLNDADLKKVFLAHVGDSFVEEDDPDFPALFDMVERHTLSVILLAKYADRISVDYVGELIQKLKDQGFSALSRVYNGRVNGYESIKNLIRMARLTEKQVYFLRCLAIMPPQGIPRKLFTEWCSAAGERNGLIQLGYVDYDRKSDIIHMHPVIWEVVWNEMGPSYENCKDFIEKSVYVGEDIISKVYNLESEKRVMYEKCYRHVSSLLPQINIDNYFVIRNLTIFFSNEGIYENNLHERFYEYSCDFFGKESFEATDALRLLSSKYHHSMPFDPSSIEKGYDINKCIADWYLTHPQYSYRHAQYAIRNTCDRMVLYYKQTKDRKYLDEAFTYLERLNEYNQNYLLYAQEAKNPDVEKINFQIKYTRLTRLYINIQLGKYEDALADADELIRYSEEFLKKKIGGSVLDIAGRNRDKADIYKELGKYDDAIEYYGKTYDIFIKFYPKNHYRLIQLFDAYVECFIRNKDQKSASAWLEKLESSAKAKYHEGHAIFKKIENYKNTITSMKKETPPC